MTPDATATYKTPNNASRMAALLSLMDREIRKYNIVGISIWSNKALDCMIQIELDNGLYIVE